MRGASYLLAGLLAAGLILYPYLAVSNSNGPRGSVTGAPITPTFNEDTCATAQCHDDAAPDTGPGRLVIDAPTEFEPGATVEITIRIEEPGREVFGFQVAVKAFLPDNDPVPIYEHISFLDLVDPVTTKYVTGNYVTHTDEGRHQNEWRVRWHAPLDSVPDSVMIYAAGNAANGDDHERGDHIYTARHTLYGDNSTATDGSAPPPAFTLDRAFPNPFRTDATIGYTLHRAAPVTLSVYDARGRRVRLLTLGMQAAGPHRLRLAAEGLAAGLYLYELRTPDAAVSRPLMLLK